MSAADRIDEADIERDPWGSARYQVSDLVLAYAYDDEPGCVHVGRGRECSSNSVHIEPDDLDDLIADLIKARRFLATVEFDD